MEKAGGWDDVLLPSRDCSRSEKEPGNYVCVLRNIPSAAQHFWRYMSILDEISTDDGVSPLILHLGSNYKRVKRTRRLVIILIILITNDSAEFEICPANNGACACLSVCLSVAGLEPFWDDAARQSGPQSPHWLTAIWATWFHSIPRKHHGGCQQQIPMIVKSASIKCEIYFVKLMN